MSERARFFSEVDVSRETRERFDVFAALLEKWNPAINLVSKTTIQMLWSRHFLDSAQVYDVVAPREGLWADLGTGGGFPGLVVSILAAERAPNLAVVAVESDVRKATFLRTVVREAGLQTAILSDRIEALAPLEANIISARALAPLPKLLSLVKPHLTETGKAVFPKGEGYEAEISESLETWSFQIDTYPSKTNPGAAILKLGDIERV